MSYGGGKMCYKHLIFFINNYGRYKMKGKRLVFLSICLIGIMLLAGCTKTPETMSKGEAAAESFLMRYYGISEEDFVIFDLPEASDSGEGVVPYEPTEAIEQVKAYYADGMTEGMLDKFFANRLVTRVQDICVAEGADKAVFKSVELKKLDGVVEEGTENYNYSCIFTVGEKEYSATGQISLVDENGVMKVDNLHLVGIEEQEE